MAATEGKCHVVTEDFGTVCMCGTKTKGDEAVWDEWKKDMKFNGIHGEYRQNWLKGDSLYGAPLLSLWILTRSAASVSLDASTDYLNYSRLSHLAPAKAPKPHRRLSVIECMPVCSECVFFCMSACDPCSCIPSCVCQVLHI